MNGVNLELVEDQYESVLLFICGDQRVGGASTGDSVAALNENQGRPTRFNLMLALETLLHTFA